MSANADEKTGMMMGDDGRLRGFLGKETQNLILLV
jgi:hypothetical protein